MMDRRRFLVTSLAGVIAAPLAVKAQPAGKVFRIGALGVGSPELLRQGLREVGYVEGPNVVIEWRDSEGKPERFADLEHQLAAVPPRRRH